MGWDIPVRGPASRIVAALGFPYFAAKERSVAKARIAFDYLDEDQTRLMPAAAFEECGAAALELVASGALDGCRFRPARADAGGGHRGHCLRPVSPISVEPRVRRRSRGHAWEFQSRMPSDPRLKQIIPVPPARFPRSSAIRI